MQRAAAEGSARPGGTVPDGLVSVSITTYNHAAYIATAVEGVLAQVTSFPVEIIVGDDCSTDGTRDILADFQRRYPDRIRLVLPERNLGGSGVPMFARTMDEVRGRYVAMLDGDDYWTAPHKLARQVAHLDAHPDCAMCFHDVLEVWDDGSQPPRRMNDPAPTAPIRIEEIMRNCPIGSCSPMFRRDAVCPLPAWFARLRVGDLPLYILAAEHGRIDFIDEVMGVWRIHGRGEWNGLDVVGQQQLVIDSHTRLDDATGGRYRDTLRRLVRAARYRLALEQIRLADLPGARRSAWALLRERGADDLDLRWLARELTLAHLRQLRRRAATGRR